MFILPFSCLVINHFANGRGFGEAQLALRPCRPLEASPIVLRTPTSVLEQSPGVDRMLNGTLRSRSERICDANQEATSTMKQLFSLVALVLFSAQALNPQVNPNSK